MASTLVKITTLTGSLVTLGFGVWHLFVPKIWQWYSYMDEKATELIAAVRAVNFFFSISLVFFGMVSLLFLFRKPVDLYSLRVQLLVMTTLWGCRVGMQLFFPQGTINPALRYGMLAAFVVTFGLFLTAFLGTFGRV